MNPLLKRLASLRWKVRVLDGWQGVCAMISLVLGIGVVVGLLDYWLQLPSLIRAGCLVSLLVGSGMIAYNFLFRPFSKPCDDLSLALRVEEAFPELNDALASTVQFLKQPPEEQDRVGGSAAMRERTMSETLAKAAACDFGRILDRRAALWFGVGAVCALLVGGLIVNYQRSYAGTAFWRFVEPFGGHTWTRISVARTAPTDLLQAQDEDKKWEPLDPAGRKLDRVAIGRPYVIRVTVEGKLPKHAKIEIEGQIRSDKVLELKPSGADKHTATIETAIDMTQQYQKFRFRVLANDGSFPPGPGRWHVVEVRPPPRLVPLDGKPSPQITIHPPLYSDLPVKHLEPGTRTLDLYAGSNVILRAKADRPLDKAWIEYHPDNKLVKELSPVTFFGQTSPLHALVQAAGGNAVYAPIPATLTQDKSVIEIAFMPFVTGSYTLHLRDDDRLEKQDSADLRINLDPLPEVKLIQPGASVTRLPSADLGFKFLVTDDIFAVKRVYVEYRKRAPDGAFLDDASTRVMLFDAKEHGHLLPSLLARPLPGADLRLRYKKLEFSPVWRLRDEFQPGDIVNIQICADDFCDIYPNREPGRSHVIELRIISARELDAQMEAKVADIIQRLQAVEKIERKAQEAVKDTRKEEKIDPQVREKFIDQAVTPQREVGDRIQSIRTDLAEIKKTLQENKRTDAKPYADASKIKGALDAIAGQELQQIDPKLADIHTELGKIEKNTTETKLKLEEAAKLQESVLKTLNDLLKTLTPEAKMQAFRNELRDINAKQEEIRQKNEQLTGDIKKALQEAVKNDPKLSKAIEERFNQDIKQNRIDQQDLADRLDKTIKEMKAAEQEFKDKGDNANAQKIHEAIEQLEKPKAEPKLEKQTKQQPPVPAQMRKAADDLKEKNEVPNKVVKQQQDIQQNIEQAVNKLENRSQDVTKKEQQDQKRAEQKLDQLMKKLDEIRNEGKEIEKEKEEQEKLKKRQELAAKIGKLQEEIAQMRRELAQLNDQAAADKLQQANNQLDKAGQDLKNNNPDGAQKAEEEARKDLEQAKREVRERQEELARELLIKIHDQLDAIKIRQVASLERSENLHAKIMKKKIWSDANLDTIENNMEAQKGIGEETGALKEKLKGAVVFHDILDKAKQAMDKAGEALEKRRDAGKELREEKFSDDDAKLENERHAAVIRQQTTAKVKLENMLEALKDEINRLDKKKDQAKDNPNQKDPNGKEGDGGQQGGMRQQDGIPHTAQLKLFRSEQLDVNRRTDDFAKQNPDLDKLTDAQKAELRDLSAEQTRLNEVFQQLTAPPPEQPMDKEGEKK